MTNKQKFKEIFGFEPDVDMGVHKCPPTIEECPYYYPLEGVRQYADNRVYVGCCCSSFWFEEYKEAAHD